jgi:hypothetical protein
MRKQIIKVTEKILIETAKRCLASQYQSKADVYANPHKLRATYINSYSSLLRSYNQLLRDTELNEFAERLEELEKEIGGDLDE